MQHIEAAARRKLGASEDWKGYQFEAVSGDYIVVGSVPVGVFTRGPRQGTPKWKGDGQKVIVSGAEVEAEIARYVAATGNCQNCFGTKEEFLSWSVSEGMKKCTCSACGGSGRAGVALQVTKG
jgi:hypothetical protein